MVWFLTLFTLVAATYLLLPRKYLSDGKLFVQVGRSSVGSSPSTSSGTVSLQDSRETEVKSVVTMIGSWDVAGRVADRIGVERILKPSSFLGEIIDNLPSISLSGTPSSDEDPSLSEEEVDKIKRRNMAIKELVENVDVEYEKKTTVITIATSLQSPFLARDVIDAYLDEYQKKHVEINHQASSGGFFDTQFQLYREQLIETEKKQKEFRDSIESLSIEGARSLLQQEVNQLILDRGNTQIEFSQMEEKAIQLARQLESIPMLIDGADTKVSSVARDGAAGAIFALQVEEAELSAKYEDTNPQLIEIRDALAKAQRKLLSIPDTFEQSAKNVSTAHQQVVVMYTEAAASALALKARLAQNAEALAMKRKEIKELNSAELEANLLNRKIEIQRNTLMKMAERRGESDTIGALDAEQISNVTIAQEASLMFKKVFPSGKIFVVFGGLFSFIVSTLLTFLRHHEIDFASSNSQSNPIDSTHGDFDSEGRTIVRETYQSFESVPPTHEFETRT